LYKLPNEGVTVTAIYYGETSYTIPTINLPQIKWFVPTTIFKSSIYIGSCYYSVAMNSFRLYTNRNAIYTSRPTLFSLPLTKAYLYYMHHKFNQYGYEINI